MLDTLDSLLLAALSEDVGQGDLTTLAVVPKDARCETRLYAKQAGVLSGIGVFQRVFQLMHERHGVRLEEWNARFDGERFVTGDLVASFNGQTRAVLTAERVALNLLQHLSGVATLTAAFVEQVGGAKARIVDTRKTTPLLRRLEREAVVHGGGVNHRFNLATGILIKENHIAAAGGVTAALRAAQALNTGVSIQVEVETLAQLDEALAAGATSVLLDNFDTPAMREAVRVTAGRALLEVSGGVNIDTIRAFAETGVDRISVGALTKDVRATDYSLRIVESV